MLVSNITKKIAEHVSEMGINISELSRKSGVTYSALYASLANNEKRRELRADELISICIVLKLNPMDFTEVKKERNVTDGRCKKRKESHSKYDYGVG